MDLNIYKKFLMQRIVQLAHLFNNTAAIQICTTKPFVNH
jgi:hypothetical protein